MINLADVCNRIEHQTIVLSAFIKGSQEIKQQIHKKISPHHFLQDYGKRYEYTPTEIYPFIFETAAKLWQGFGEVLGIIYNFIGNKNMKE